MPRIILIAAFFVVALAPDLALAATVNQNQTVACQSKSDLQDIIQAVQAGDLEQGDRLISLGVALGICRFASRGTKAFVYERNVWEGVAKVRFDGDPATYWTLQGYIDE